LIQPSNLDMNDAVCLHVVHVLQHPTSRPTTRSTQNTIVNAAKMNRMPLPAGKNIKSMKHSTGQHHQASIAMSGLEADRVRVLGALCSLRCKKKLAVEN
jgi:hypothetical protein